jgi:hypothetical protein
MALQLKSKDNLDEALGNQYWPAHYFVDARGRRIDHHFGEGDYDKSERVIQRLLAEAGARNVASATAISARPLHFGSERDA